MPGAQPSPGGPAQMLVGRRHGAQREPSTQRGRRAAREDTACSHSPGVPDATSCRIHLSSCVFWNRGNNCRMGYGVHFGTDLS